MKYTYIIKYEHKKYYCGITNNINRRMKEHKNKNKEKIFKPIIEKVIYIKGNYEKRIKFNGVEHTFKMIENFKIFMMKNPSEGF